MRKKIMLIYPDPAQSGGINVFMNSVYRSFSEQYSDVGIDRVFTSSSTRIKKIISFFIAVFKVFKGAALDASDCFYVSSGSGKSALRKAIVILPAIVFRRKVVFHMHGGLFNEWAFGLSELEILFFRFVFSRVYRFYIINPDHMIPLKKVFGLDNDKITIVDNFVDGGPELFIKNKNKKIVFLGGVSSSKGVDLLCDAFSKIETEYKLYLYGPLGDLSTSGLVHEYYKGMIDKEKWDVLSEAAILVLPSKFENFPLVFIEAARASCLILYTGVGCINKHFKHQVDYIRIDHDVDSIKKVIESSIEKFEELEFIRREAFHKSLKYRSLNFIRRLYSDAFSD